MLGWDIALSSFFKLMAEEEVFKNCGHFISLRPQKVYHQEAAIETQFSVGKHEKS